MKRKISLNTVLTVVDEMFEPSIALSLLKTRLREAAAKDELTNALVLVTDDAAKNDVMAVAMADIVIQGGRVTKNRFGACS